MITVNVDSSAFGNLAKQLVTASQADTLLREVAENVRTLQRVRIHEDGQKADGSTIGQYSKGYLKLRLEKGKPSDKVILFWEGDLANQYQVIPLSDTEYALGWYNPKQGLIAKGMEEGNGKWSGYGKIWGLTEKEIEEIRLTVQEFITKTFS